MAHEQFCFCLFRPPQQHCATKRVLRRVSGDRPEGVGVKVSKHVFGGCRQLIAFDLLITKFLPDEGRTRHTAKGPSADVVALHF